LCYPSSPSPPLYTWCWNPAPPSITISLSYFSFVRYITFLHTASHPCNISPSSYTISRTTSRLYDIFSLLYILFHILLHICLIYHRLPTLLRIRVTYLPFHPCDRQFFYSM